MTDETGETVISEERLTDALEDKDAIRTLLVSAGWKLILEVIKADAERLTKAALEPITDIKVILATEHEKGAAQYATSIMQLPQTLLDIAEDTIEAYKEKENDDG